MTGRVALALLAVTTFAVPALADEPIPDAERGTAPEAESESEAAPDLETTPEVALPVFTPGQCASSDVAAIAERHRRAVLRIEAPGATGLGFVFRDERHVATALSIVDTGRGVRVIFDDGRRVAAEVVAADASRDLAILELAVDAPVGPISVASRPVEVGDPVVAMTLSDDMRSVDPRAKHRKMRRRRWRLDKHQSVISPGVMTSVNGDRLRTGALTGRHLSWGAPVLDCKGELVGISITPFTDVVIGADGLTSLGKEKRDGDYRSGWSFYHPIVSGTYQFDQSKHDHYGRRDQWLGFSAGAALIGHDRWFFPVRFSATWLVSPKPETQFLDRDAYRLAGGLSAGYRWMLMGGRVPIYLVPQVGANLIYERETLRTTDFVLPGPCEAGPCAVQPIEYQLQSDAWRLLPSAGLGIQVGYGELRYEVQLDTDDTGRSIHQLTLGAQF